MDDLISRQAAIDAIEHRLTEPAYQHTGEDWYVGMNCAESELYDLPSVQPELFADADKLKRCRFEYINACKTLHNRTPDTRQQDIYDAYAVIKALQPIFGEETFA